VTATTAGCNRVASAADEIAKVVVISARDVDVLAQREATSAGKSSDDVVQVWRQRVIAAGSKASQASSEVKEPACEIVTDVGYAVVTQTRYDVTSALQTMRDNAFVIPSLANMQLVADIEAELTKIENSRRPTGSRGGGQPDTLQLLIFQAIDCAAVSS